MPTAANELLGLGVRTDDQVANHLPMIPEAAIAMLACARIGAPHSVGFGGFCVQALQPRIVDARATLVITADGGFRRGVPAALEPAVDEALAKGRDPVRHVLVVRRAGQGTTWTAGRSESSQRCTARPVGRG